MLRIAAIAPLLAVVAQTAPGPSALLLHDMEGRAAERWQAAATPVAQPLKEGQQALRWTVPGSIARSMIPHDWSAFDRLEMWLHSESPSRAIVALALSSDDPDTPPEEGLTCSSIRTGSAPAPSVCTAR